MEQLVEVIYVDLSLRWMWWCTPHCLCQECVPDRQVRTPIQEWGSTYESARVWYHRRSHKLSSTKWPCLRSSSCKKGADQLSWAENIRLMLDMWQRGAHAEGLYCASKQAGPVAVEVCQQAKCSDRDHHRLPSEEVAAGHCVVYCLSLQHCLQSITT